MTMSGIDATYGSAFVGLIAGAILYGVTILQTYLYFRSYPKDSVIIKSMVLFLWFLDTMHLVLCTLAMYWYLITNYANPSALFKATWSMNLQTDCNGLIGLIVECFFARRVWIMSANCYLTSIIIVLACIHFGLGVVFTVDSFILVSTTEYKKLVWVTSTGLGSAAAADIIIAVSLCYYLLKSRTGFSRTDSLITTLMVYSLTTGLVTSVIAFAAVITFAIMPTNYIWLAFFWILGKCYVNSFLAALNSRDSLRTKVKPQEGTFLQLSPFQATAASNHSPVVSHRHLPQTPLAVIVHTATVSKTDYLDSPTSAMTPSCSSSMV